MSYNDSQVSPVRPASVLEEHLIFLDDLRESGITNMWGATPYLKEMFGCNSKESKDILLYWMQTFKKNVVRSE